ncbi:MULTISPECIES: hypothetical protein [Acutalibacteraceae]|uniref:hypothetical protein n=1 Tax=Acutalibacteraceae TaxID=3082771 RepID=UPI0013E8CF18|nr:MULTISPECIES: hypothetical protein [Acutalibacteraceae]
MQHYDNLYGLIQQSQEAERYFHSLPNYVREAINQRAQSINSIESLRDYAENLTRDDE